MSFRRQLKKNETYELTSKENICVVEDGDVCGIVSFDFIDQTTIDIKEVKIITSETYVWSEFENYLAYWLPYIDTVKCQLKHSDYMINLFKKDLKFKAKPIHKVKLIDILPEQLTVDETKIKSVRSWVKKPEDIMICGMRYNDQWLCLDGYSRLMVALEKNFEYVYLYDEAPEDDSFYQVCRRWCISKGVISLKDLKDKIVSPEEHQSQWIDRCQRYLKLEKKPALCFDLQGTLGGEGLGDIRAFEFFSHTLSALKEIDYSKYLLYIITNQSHIGKGDFTWETYLEYELKLRTWLENNHIPLEDFLCCPHTHEDNCLCKKPKPGLIHQMLDQRPLDLEHSYIIGDMGFDMLLAKAVACKRILVKTGNGVGTLTNYRDTWDAGEADYVAEDVYDAVKWINKS